MSSLAIKRISWQQEAILAALEKANGYCFTTARKWIRVEAIMTMAIVANRHDLIHLIHLGYVKFDKAMEYVTLLERGRRALEA